MTALAFYIFTCNRFVLCFIHVVCILPTRDLIGFYYKLDKCARHLGPRTLHGIDGGWKQGHVLQLVTNSAIAAIESFQTFIFSMSCIIIEQKTISEISI